MAFVLRFVCVFWGGHLLAVEQPIPDGHPVLRWLGGRLRLTTCGGGGGCVCVCVCVWFFISTYTWYT